LKNLNGILLVVLSALLFGAYYLTLPSKEYCSVEWTGEVDSNFEKIVAESLKRNCDTLYVTLDSPGGYVDAGLSVVARMRDFQKDGGEIAIHGRGTVASAATWILGAGTRGQRTIAKNTLTLIHGMQRVSTFSHECVGYKTEYEDLIDDENKINDGLMDTIATLYAEETGYSAEDTLTWMNCRATTVGNGEMLVNYNLADKVS
jgi:ATP-dependent protease ClpP protease subunit